MTTRPAAVAGLFYPAEPDQLGGLVDLLLAGVETGPVAAAPPLGLVAPHAGYRYSGPTAATAYAQLRPWRASLHQVVVVGPAHRVPVRGLAVPSSTAFATPLGEVTVDAELRDLALAHPVVRVDDAAHALEHCIEVQLPFLQRLLGSWTVLPLLAGAAGAATVADALEPLWGRPGTLVVVSTDLSHYHDQGRAQALDRRTAAAVVARDVAAIGPDDACGAVPLRGLLELARRHDVGVRQLDLRTSADTAGDAARVVGYGSFCLP